MKLKVNVRILQMLAFLLRNNLCKKLVVVAQLKSFGFLLIATGVGKTKKDAKQDAAKNLLLQLDSRLIEKFDSRFSNKEEISQPELDPEAPGNPVGELNEFCLRAKKIVPEYEVWKAAFLHASVSVNCASFHSDFCSFLG